MKVAVRRIFRTVGVAVALVVASLPFAGQAAFGATGTVLADFVPGGATGNGRGVAFDGTNLWYTIVGDPHIYQVTTSGAFLGSITVGGPGAQGGPLAWDGSALWTADYSNTSTLLRVNPANGAILSSCDFAAANPGNPAVFTPGKGIGFFPDGLDWTGSTLWMSGEGGGNPGNWVAELNTSCGILNSFVAPPHGGDGTSGVAFVADPFNGNTLWHGVPGEFSGTGPSIFQTDTSGVPTGSSFPAIHLVEDLAFDPVTFAPRCALWANEPAVSNNHLTAYEIPCPEQAIRATGGFVLSGTEPAAFTNATVATFTDPDPNSVASDYSATIDWGDSTGTTAGVVSGPTGGPFTVKGSHTYADEGNYTITVTITDADTPTNTATVTDSSRIADAALTAGTVTVTGGVEGVTPSNATFTFSDANTTTSSAADFTATCKWGDGSPDTNGTVSGSGGSYTVDCGSHQYAEEPSYTVTVSVTDDGGSTTSGSGTAKVADAPLTSSCAASSTSPQSFSGPTATFNDTNPSGTGADFTATINWGDASSSAGTITGGPGLSPYTVSGSHTYASTGIFTITTNVKDDGGSTTSASCTVVVFAFAPGGGSFVIGDLNSAVGTSVTFWGAQWWKLNSLSGGAAPSAFKGFALNPKTPACGTGWSTDPGNSAPPPPGPLPAFMAVIVSSSISNSGSQISGNTPHIVVVQTNPGYDANPGHAGTGKVVAQVC